MKSSSLHNLSRDPLGHYFILGLSPRADRAAIKAAYRRRAKELHPDHSSAPNAQEEFQHLVEAYRVLSDPDLRAAYDGEGPVAAKPRRQTEEAPSAVSCSACRRLAAQPRYVVIPVVKARPRRTVVESVEGVFCRRCADLAAKRAAVRNWIGGWWSVQGLLLTPSALVVCLRGGRFPASRNYGLLIRQARAFLARRDDDLAKGLAQQAVGFASSPEEKSRAEDVMRAARDATRQLKDRWRGPSRERLVQLVPLAGLTAAGLAGLAAADVNLWGRNDPGPVAERPVPELIRPLLLLRTNQLYEVTAPVLPVRSGPSGEAHQVAALEAGAVVLVTENAPEGGWVRILTAEGVSGFVSGRYLTPNLPNIGFDGSIRSDGGR